MSDGIKNMPSTGLGSMKPTVSLRFTVASLSLTEGSILWAARVHVFILDESGKCFVIRAGTYFALLATNQIDGLFWSSPASARDSLLLRGVNKLYCIREAGK